MTFQHRAPAVVDVLRVKFWKVNSVNESSVDLTLVLHILCWKKENEGVVLCFSEARIEPAELWLSGNTAKIIIFSKSNV